MELLLKRSAKSDTSTIGKLMINGKQICVTLEDKDRDLVNTMAAADIAKVKVYAKTAIPRGRYEVIMSYSARFKKVLPLLLNVPGFAGIRIHPGNKPEDTEGCILPGIKPDTDWVGQSREAFERLMGFLKPAFEREKIYITIE